MNKPKTREEILSLPHVESFTYEAALEPDGKTIYHRPILRREEALHFEPDDLMLVSDDEGQLWRLAKVEGQYVRQKSKL